MPRRLSPLLSRLIAACGSIILLCSASAQRAAAEPALHERIDQLISARSDFAKHAAPASSDAEFLRRAHLDLTGIIPTSSAARTFLADASPTKRRELIEQLLASPQHARHLQRVLDVLLMERRPSKHVAQAAWQEYLHASAAANKPWDQLVRELLSADGADPKTRPAARFMLDRDAEPHVLTKDISRLFLGKDYSCNQCHDSPIVDDFKQADYYGIFAFVNRGFVFTDKSKLAILAEKAEGDATFQSVFDPAKTTKTSGPRLPGAAPVEEPQFEKGKEYDVAPAKEVRPIPKFSRRAQLAPLLAAREHRQFSRHSANRFWSQLLGRGLIHPIDMDHEANPPSHPELLDLLATELAALNFDLRSFFRELALSATYQRSSEPASLETVPPDLFAVAKLKPLTAEQLAWSVMQATGHLDAERQALGKDPKEGALEARLAGSVASFVVVYGGQPGMPEGQSFQATLDQALFLSNGAVVRTWLAPRPGNLTDRLARLPEAPAAAEELYLSVLTRPPTAEESQEVADYLKTRDKDRAAALQELTWALLASVEFRFNH